MPKNDCVCNPTRKRKSAATFQETAEGSIETALERMTEPRLASGLNLPVDYIGRHIKEVLR